MADAASTTHDDLARSRRYSRTRELLWLAALVSGWVTQASLLFSGRANALARRTAAVGGGKTWLADGLFAVAYSLISALLSLPLDVARGYVVEHAFGLSNQSPRAWTVDHAKRLGLGLAFEVPSTLVTVVLIRRFPRTWWLVMAGVMAPVSVLLSYLYPVLLAPIFNRFTPLTDAALERRVRRLAERANVAVARVDVVDMSAQTKKVNAFFAGLGSTRRIALGDTLIAECTADEIEVVVAHELGHQVHRDIWKGIGLGTLGVLGGAGALAVMAPAVARRLRTQLGFARIDTVAAMPLLGLLGSILSIVGLPLINACSRHWMERPADQYALELTDNPAAFVSVMDKLHRLNLTDPNPPALVKHLLYSHPTASERIAAAEAYTARQQGAKATP